MDIQKKRVLLLVFIVGVVALSIAAEKCRHLIGEDSSSQSGKFTIFNCFDMSTGTLACTVKEGVKLYFYNLRATHIERVRNLAIEQSLVDAIGQGLSSQDAAKQAQKEGAKAAKLAKRQAKRIIGPIISSGWDFFEAIYYGGTMTEGFLRGSGTLVGAYGGGLFGEQSLGRIGYLIGSHLGSWVGGRIGLMVYDIVSGVHYLLQFTESGEAEVGDHTFVKESEVSESFEAPPRDTSDEVHQDFGFYESSPDENSESHRNSEGELLESDMSVEVNKDSGFYESSSDGNSESYGNSEFR